MKRFLVALLAAGATLAVGVGTAGADNIKINPTGPPLFSGGFENGGQVIHCAAEGGSGVSVVNQNTIRDNRCVA
jgi:hypothetical protein